MLWNYHHFHQNFENKYENTRIHEKETLSCLVHNFKHIFSIFKHHYMYFYIFFHLYIFLKNWKLLFKHTYQTDPKSLISRLVLFFFFFFFFYEWKKKFSKYKKVYFIYKGVLQGSVKVPVGSKVSSSLIKSSYFPSN